MIKFLGNVAAVILLMAFSGLWGGYVLSVLWNWFASDHFGLQSINLLQAIGMMIVVSFMTHQQSLSSDKAYGEVLAESYIYAALKPLMFLMVGWFWLQALS